MRPKASSVLTAYLKQCNEPPWTSYFIRVDRKLRHCKAMARYVMVVAVSILAVAICLVFLAYLAFNEGDNSAQDAGEYADAGSLRMIALVFRHGARLPTELYTNDPYNTHDWEGGLGSLTPKGSMQLYNLGRTMNARYKGLLPASGLYSAENMFVLSSASERCLMSAQAFLAGFLPPVKANLPIAWQPAAINLLPRDRDYLLAQKMACPKYDQMLSDLYNRPQGDILEVIKQNTDLFKYLTEHTGQNVTNTNDVEFLYNTLYIEHEMGLTLPSWTKAVFPDKMRPLAARNLALLTETPFMRNVKGGALVTDIAKKIITKAEEPSKQKRNILLYSAHDVTLVNVMRALDIINQTSDKPDFGATLAIELHYDPNATSNHTVKIFYFNDTAVNIPRQIKLPNCNDPCSLQDFRSSIDPMFVYDFADSCKL